MKPKPKKTPTPKRKPAAIVVGRNTNSSITFLPGDKAIFKGGLVTELMGAIATRNVLWKLKPGQYIRFVQDGGVRKARRVK